MRRHREHVASPAFMSHRTLCRLHSVHARILREILGTWFGVRESSGVKPPCGEADDASPLASKWMRFRFIVSNSAMTPAWQSLGNNSRSGDPLQPGALPVQIRGRITTFGGRSQNGWSRRSKLFDHVEHTMEVWTEMVHQFGDN